MSSPIPVELRRWPLSGDQLEQLQGWLSWGPFCHTIEDLCAMERIIIDIGETAGTQCRLYHAEDGIYVLASPDQVTRDAFCVMIAASIEEEEFVTIEDILEKFDDIVQTRWASLSLDERFDLLDRHKLSAENATLPFVPGHDALWRGLTDDARDKMRVDGFTGLSAVIETCPSY